MPLRLVRRPKSPYWVLRGTIRRIRIEESTGTDNKKIAEEIRAKREAELLAESVYGRRATATFAQAALSYLEHGGSKRFLNRIISHFGITALARIDQDAIDRAARELYPNASNSTLIRQCYVPTAAVLSHAAKRGWCAKPIIERPKTPKPRIRWITLVEADRLIDACADHLRPLVIFLIYTGARAGEALWLDWHNVDLEREHVIFPKSKNGHARGVPLHQRVLNALLKLPHRDGEVFRRPDGLPYERPKGDDDENQSAGSRIKTAFQGACRRAGIKDFHPHDCRHTFATWHYAHNRDLTALMRIGGWRDIKSVIRYMHVNVDELRNTMDRLPGGNLGDANNDESNTTDRSSA
jgi:integrase